jgi:hypothetical protein
VTAADERRGDLDISSYNININTNIPPFLTNDSDIPEQEHEHGLSAAAAAASTGAAGLRAPPTPVRASSPPVAVETAGD